jgi:hypothetical protein
MPSVSKKQHGFMAAVANNPKFAKKVGVSKSIGEEFMKADKGRKFKEGGLKETDAASNPGLAKLPTAVRNKMGYMKKGGMAHSDIKMDKKVVKKAVGMHEKQLHGGKKSDLAALKKGGKVKKFALGGLSQEQMPPQMPTGLTIGRQHRGNSSGAYGALDAVNQGSRHVGQSLDTIGGALGKPSGQGGIQMKKGGKVKKFAEGGISQEQIFPQRPPQIPSPFMRQPYSGGNSSGAYGGLDTVNQGSRQVGQSLSTIGSALGKPGGGQGLVGLGSTLGARLGMKKGGAVKTKKMASGGSVSSASKRADGCAVKGKTKGSMVKMKKGGSC